MASIGEALSTAATAVEGGAEAVGEFLGMSDAAAESTALAGAGSAAKVSAIDPALQAGLEAQDIADIDMAATVAPSVGGFGHFLDDFAVKAIEPLVNQMAAAALKPRISPRTTPAAGHGVNLNTGTLSEPFKEIDKLSGGDPLAGLDKFSHLF